jgi:long-subunit fatty acid transport protein
VRYAQVGAQIDVLPNLTVALAWRGEFRLALEIDATVLGSVVVGGGMDALRVPGRYDLASRSTAVFLPHNAVLGVRYQPRPSLSLLADLTFQNYSAYTNPTARLDVGLDLTPPPGLNLPIPTLPPGTDPVPAGFSDTVSLRVGAEWRARVRAHELALRAGYRFEPTPVPEQRARATNFLDSDRHGASLGAGFTVRALPGQPASTSLSIDVHGAVQALVPRTYRKTDPTDPIGDLALAGTVVDAGATASLRF